MDSIYSGLSVFEKIPLKLGDLYGRYGYGKYRMAKFEPYDLYRAHKGFLKSEGILTFNDKRGRLLALKPDVTISIVNSIKPEDGETKFFYIENVYRTEGGEYKEINQIGLEHIGGDGIYAEAEVLWLAYKSLETVSEEFVLNIGHTGIWSVFFETTGTNTEIQNAMLQKIKNKNLHELKSLAVDNGLSDKVTEKLLALASVSGKFDEETEKITELLSDMPDSASVLTELQDISESLRAVGAIGKCSLDLSVINDLTYYNGLIFQGFLRGISKAVLAGGRYDNLMTSFGKKQRALGFAIYTDELQTAFRENKSAETDVVLFCGNGNVAKALKAVKEFADKGLKVNAACKNVIGTKAKKAYILSEDGRLEEISKC